MLLPTIARHASRAPRDQEPHTGWRRALRQVREERPPPDALAGLVAGLPSDQQVDALADLVMLDLQLSWRTGSGRRLADYPGLPDPLPEDLRVAEAIARHQLPFGDLPEPRGLLGALADRYVLLRRVGAGAMGEVWQACDRRERRYVAVKQPMDGRDLSREARVLGLLAHPGIVPLLDRHGESLVLGFADGPTLGERIFAGDDRATLLRALIQVCRAVAHAHQRGVVHGDLKPDNVRLDERPILLDWGLARIGSSECGVRSGREVSGTPEYMAPEQADGTADAASDVFGLGAVLYELLTGSPPHRWPGGARPTDWAAHVRRCQIAPPRKLARVSRGLQRICLRALAVDPGERWPSAEALAAALERA